MSNYGKLLGILTRGTELSKYRQFETEFIGTTK
jgi:hypothetical protein